MAILLTFVQTISNHTSATCKPQFYVLIGSLSNIFALSFAFA